MSAKEPAADPAEKPAQTPEEIRAGIEETRQDLGDTVEALAAKTDVKGRARARVEGLKADATAKKDELTAKVKEQASPSSSSSSSSDGGGVPAQAQRLSQQALARAKENPLPVAAAGALLLGYLIGRRRGR